MAPTTSDSTVTNLVPPPRRSLSPLQMRLRRFRRLKRGYYSFIALFGAYFLSFFLAFLMNDKALVVRHDGRWYFPACRAYLHDTFGDWFTEHIHEANVFGQKDTSGEPLLGEANYRKLRAQFQAEGKQNFVVLPFVPFDPYESFLELEGNPPHPPAGEHWFGTDDRGRDILVRLAYGYRVSMTFALLVVITSYAIGILAGATLGYFGRWVDLIGQRFVEIWGAIPFLYTVIILSAIFQPSFVLLALILTAFDWLSITYYLRGEFYREKAKDYVAAAIATGEGNLTIMVRHILPNSLTPIITFAPFAIVAAIESLVALDYLGFGLRPPTPSWGELLRQAQQNLRVWHLVVFPLGAIFVTLQLVVFIGEAVREAFDPKVFSRLR